MIRNIFRSVPTPRSPPAFPGLTLPPAQPQTCCPAVPQTPPSLRPPEVSPALVPSPLPPTIPSPTVPSPRQISRQSFCSLGSQFQSQLPGKPFPEPTPWSWTLTGTRDFARAPPAVLLEPPDVGSVCARVNRGVDVFRRQGWRELPTVGLGSNQQPEKRVFRELPGQGPTHSGAGVPPPPQLAAHTRRVPSCHLASWLGFLTEGPESREPILELRFRKSGAKVGGGGQVWEGG